VRSMADAQWGVIQRHFPAEHKRGDCRGRKATPARKVLKALLWILITDAQVSGVWFWNGLEKGQIKSAVTNPRAVRYDRGNSNQQPIAVDVF
jgi:hypothetical protein